MTWLNVIFIIVSVALIGVILLQNRSAGLGSAFGSAAEGFNVRRGSEKRIFQATIILATLFLLLSIIHLFIG